MSGYVSIEVDTAGTLEQVRAEIQAMPRGVTRARRRAGGKLRTWVRRQVLRAVAQSAGVTQKVLKARNRFASVVKKDGELLIWIGTNPIAAHHLGTVRWTRRMAGARVGRRLFPGSWSWGPGSRTGTAVMQRVGRGRLPIERVNVPIHEAARARILGMEDEVGERYRTLLAQELNYALRVEGAK